MIHLFPGPQRKTSIWAPIEFLSFCFLSQSLRLGDGLLFGAFFGVRGEILFGHGLNKITGIYFTRGEATRCQAVDPAIVCDQASDQVRPGGGGEARGLARGGCRSARSHDGWVVA